MTIDSYYTFLVAAITVGAVAFPVMYHVTARWWVTPFGRHLMGYSTVAALLSVAAVVRVFFPDLPGQEAFRMVALTLALFVVWQRLFIYARTQRRERIDS